MQEKHFSIEIDYKYRSLVNLHTGFVKLGTLKESFVSLSLKCFTVGIENNLFCGLKDPSFRPEARMHVTKNILENRE